MKKLSKIIAGTALGTLIIAILRFLWDEARDERQYAASQAYPSDPKAAFHTAPKPRQVILVRADTTDELALGDTRSFMERTAKRLVALMPGSNFYIVNSTSQGGYQTACVLADLLAPDAPQLISLNFTPWLNEGTAPSAILEHLRTLTDRLGSEQIPLCVVEEATMIALDSLRFPHSSEVIFDRGGNAIIELPVSEDPLLNMYAGTVPDDDLARLK